MPRRQATEKLYGNIKVKLDSESAEHNHLTYYHFDLMCRLNVPKTVIARLFNMKAASTIEVWQKQREQLTDNKH